MGNPELIASTSAGDDCAGPWKAELVVTESFIVRRPTRGRSPVR